MAPIALPTRFRRQEPHPPLYVIFLLSPIRVAQDLPPHLQRRDICICATEVTPPASLMPWQPDATSATPASPYQDPQHSWYLGSPTCRAHRRPSLLQPSGSYFPSFRPQNTIQHLCSLSSSRKLSIAICYTCAQWSNLGFRGQRTSSFSPSKSSSCNLRVFRRIV